MFLYHDNKNSHGTIIMGFIITVLWYYRNIPTLVIAICTNYQNNLDSHKLTPNQFHLFLVEYHVLQEPQLPTHSQYRSCMDYLGERIDHLFLSNVHCSSIRKGQQVMVVELLEEVDFLMMDVNLFSKYMYVWINDGLLWRNCIDLCIVNWSV